MIHDHNHDHRRQQGFRSLLTSDRRKFQSIPPTDDAEIKALEAADRINANPNFAYCFPTDVWRQIVTYLSFLQITHLAQINRFFFSFCKPILSKFTSRGAVYIRISPTKLNVQFIETSIEALNPEQTLSCLFHEVDSKQRFPASEIFLEQDPAYFAHPWQLYWDSLFRHLAPGTQFLKELSLRNIHCSKAEFVSFIIPCGKLKKLYLDSCYFNEYIFIEADLYDQNPSLRIIQISQCPEIICDKRSRKYFLKTLQFSEKNIYDRKHSAYRESRNQLPTKTVHNFEKIGFNFIQLLSILFAPFHCGCLAAFYVADLPSNFYHLFVILPIFVFITLIFCFRFSPLYYNTKFHAIHKIECFLQTSVFSNMSSTQILFSYIFYAIAFFFLLGVYVPLAFQSAVPLSLEKLISLAIVSFIIVLFGIFMVLSWFWEVIGDEVEKRISCL